MVENDTFWAFARCSLPLVQAKRSLRSLKALILRRRPANPQFHCRPCFVSEFCFLALFASLAFSLFFVYLFCSSRHRSPFALALFSGAAAAAAGRGSPPPPGAAWDSPWRYRFMNTVLEEHDGTRQEEQGGWANPSYQPPPLLGPPFAAGNSNCLLYTSDGCRRRG